MDPKTKAQIDAIDAQIAALSGSTGGSTALAGQILKLKDAKAALLAPPVAPPSAPPAAAKAADTTPPQAPYATSGAPVAGVPLATPINADPQAMAERMGQLEAKEYEMQVGRGPDLTEHEKMELQSLRGQGIESKPVPADKKTAPITLDSDVPGNPDDAFSRNYQGMADDATKGLRAFADTIGADKGLTTYADLKALADKNPKKYAEWLKSIGAEEVNIPGYGTAMLGSTGNQSALPKPADGIGGDAGKSGAVGGGLYPPAGGPGIVPPANTEAEAQKMAPDWLKGIATKFGVSLLELVNAFAMGQAGVTGMQNLATGQRLAREAEKAQLDASVKEKEADRKFQAAQTAAERAYQESAQTAKDKRDYEQAVALAKMNYDNAVKIEGMRQTGALNVASVKPATAAQAAAMTLGK